MVPQREKGSLYGLGRLVELCDVAFWHLTDKPTVAEFVRFWTIADKGQPGVRTAHG